jgi:hypothetical protein
MDLCTKRSTGFGDLQHLSIGQQGGQPDFGRVYPDLFPCRYDVGLKFLASDGVADQRFDRGSI